MEAKLFLALFLVLPSFAFGDFESAFKSSLDAAEREVSDLLRYTRYDVPDHRNPIISLTIREDTLNEKFLLNIIKRRLAGDRDLNNPGFQQIYGGGKQLEIETGSDWMWEFPPKAGTHQGIRVYVQAKKWTPTPAGRSGKYGDLDDVHADEQKKKLVCTVASENDDARSNVKTYSFFILFGGPSPHATSVRAVNVEGCVDASGNAIDCEVDVTKAKPLSVISDLWSNPPAPCCSTAKKRRCAAPTL